MAEVRRLEDVRYQQMVDLVLSKGAELSAMCTDSHVAEPAGLQEALAAIHGSDRNPGAAAELLAKLLHMLAEVQVGFGGAWVLGWIICWGWSLCWGNAGEHMSDCCGIFQQPVIRQRPRALCWQRCRWVLRWPLGAGL